MKKQNRKRIVIFAIIAIFIVGAIAGVYANTVQSDADGQTTANTPVQQLWDNVTDALTGQKLSKFDQMVRVMERTVTEPETFNELMYNFMYIEKAYHLSQKQMDYISECVIDGCKMSDIIQIVYFWVDTNEEISIIRQMYDAREEYLDMPYWTEHVFNQITNNKCGVLSEEEYREYLVAGLTKNDIAYANKLCRKGVYTIQEILDKRIEGISNEIITAEIEGWNIPQTMAVSDEQLLEEKTMLERLEIARLTGNPEVMYSKTEKESLQETEEEILDEVRREIRERGLFKYAEDAENGGEEE